MVIISKFCSDDNKCTTTNIQVRRHSRIESEKCIFWAGTGLCIHGRAALIPAHTWFYMVTPATTPVCFLQLAWTRWIMPARELWGEKWTGILTLELVWLIAGLRTFSFIFAWSSQLVTFQRMECSADQSTLLVSVAGRHWVWIRNKQTS